MTNLKKASIASIVVLLLIIGFAMASSAVNSGTVTKEAKLRKTASNDSIVLEIIPKKEQVEILGTEGQWYQVRYNKIKGYVLKDYIEVKEVSQTNTVEQEAVTNNYNIEEIKKGDNITLKDETKLYIRPLINSKVIVNIEKETTITIEEIRNGWFYINTEVGNGWIRLSNTDTDTTVPAQEGENDTQENKNDVVEGNELNKTAYVISSGINFREEPNTDAKVIKVFAQNAKITILEDQGEWYKVKYNDQVGYVIKTYVSEKKSTTTSRSGTDRTKQDIGTEVNQTETKEVESNTNTSTSSSNKGQQVADYVKQFVGYKYVYGGSTPKGFDCSGLTMYVYKQFGVSLSHSATAQSKVGTKVSRSNLQPGDLVFFTDYKTNKGIGHVGIYIGNNQFVHASTEKTGVKTSTLSGSYNSRYVTATRLF